MQRNRAVWQLPAEGSKAAKVSVTGGFSKLLLVFKCDPRSQVFYLWSCSCSGQTDG